MLGYGGYRGYSPPYSTYAVIELRQIVYTVCDFDMKTIEVTLLNISADRFSAFLCARYRMWSHQHFKGHLLV